MILRGALLVLLVASAHAADPILFPNRQDGAMFASAIPSPDGAFDLLVQLGVSAEGGGPTATAAAKAYQQRLNEDPIGVTEAIAVAAWDGLFAAAGR